MSQDFFQNSLSYFSELSNVFSVSRIQIIIGINWAATQENKSKIKFELYNL